MKSAILAATVLAIGALAQDGAKINTPTSLVQCQPTKLTWAGGKAPYWVSALPGGEASGAPLKDWGQQTGNSLTWTVDLPEGTSISMQIKDSDGNVNYAQAVTIRAGSDTSCLAGSSTTSGSDSVGADAGAGAGPAGGAAAGGSSAAAGGASAAAGGASSAAAGGASAAAGGASSAGAAAPSAAAPSGSAATKPSGSAAVSGAATSATPTPASSAGRIAASTGLVGAAALFLAAFL